MIVSFVYEQRDPSGGYRQHINSGSGGSASTYTSAPLGGGQGYGRWASSLGGAAAATGVINSSSGEAARSAARLKEIRARYEKREQKERKSLVRQKSLLYLTLFIF